MSQSMNPQTLAAPTFLTNRRAFLKSILATWAASCVFPWQHAWASDAPPTSDWPVWLQNITGQREATIRLGRAYLESHPAEQEPDHLLSLIDQALVKLPDIDHKQLNDSTRIAEALKRLVRAEYINDDVVNPLGWVLSVTEARLYAWLLLSRDLEIAICP